MRLASILASMLLALPICLGQSPGSPPGTSRPGDVSSPKPTVADESRPFDAVPLRTRPRRSLLNADRDARINLPINHPANSASPTGSPAGGEDGGGNPVPEPSTLLLVGGGLVGVALTSRWRRRRHA